MKLRVPLATAILVPVALTIIATVALVLFLSATSNIASVKQTLTDQQNEMIQVLTAQFAGSVRFAKMEPVADAFTRYAADPDFGLSAAGAVNAQGEPILEFGENAELVARALEVAAEAHAGQKLVSIREGNQHIAAYPAYFGKENELVGAVVMSWDLSIHDAGIISQQSTNGLIGLAIAGAAIGALALFLMHHVTRPMRRLTQISTALAEGDLDVGIVGEKRADELGDMARAIGVFRANSRMVRDMTDEEAARLIADAEARRRMMATLQQAFGEVVDAATAGDFSRRVDASFSDAELNGLAASVNTLVGTVDRGLSETGAVMAALADADLTRRMEGDYRGAFARLKEDTNRVADSLSGIVGKLKHLVRPQDGNRRNPRRRERSQRADHPAGGNDRGNLGGHGTAGIDGDRERQARRSSERQCR
jgi:methyl-accepting chemotaxis protein